MTPVDYLIPLFFHKVAYDLLPYRASNACARIGVVVAYPAAEELPEYLLRLEYRRTNGKQSSRCRTRCRGV